MVKVINYEIGFSDVTMQLRTSIRGKGSCDFWTPWFNSFWDNLRNEGSFNYHPKYILSDDLSGLRGIAPARDVLTVGAFIDQDGYIEDNSSETDTASDTETETDADSTSESESDLNENTDSNTYTYTDPTYETASDSETDSDSHTDSDTESETEVNWDGAFWRQSQKGGYYSGRIKPDFSAPGVGVVAAIPLDFNNISYVVETTNDGLHTRVSNTEIASAIAAGMGALFLQKNPWATLDDFRRAIEETADIDVFIGNVPNQYSGYGKINLYKLMKWERGKGK